MKSAKKQIDKKLIFFSSVFFLITASFWILDKSKQKSRGDQACRAVDYSGTVVSDQAYAIFERRKIFVPRLAFSQRPANVLGASYPNRWIEVDLSEQTLRAWDGDSLFLETKVSTGLPWFATPEGEFRIWSKIRATRMEGGSGKYYYNLPNVPFVMFFENKETPGMKGFSLHGTYWHDEFGTPRSHGCVNLRTSVAEKLFYWTSPEVPDNKNFVRAGKGEPGTKIVIHE